MIYGLDVTYSSSLPFRLAVGDSGRSSNLGGRDDP